MMMRAIKHDLRQKIILALPEEGLTVTEITFNLRMSQSAISQHLTILREAGLVVAEREGKFVRYKQNTQTLGVVEEFINSIHI